MTTIRSIGSFFVPVSEEEHWAALACRGTAEFADAELQSVALVELEVLNAPPEFDIAQVKQPHTLYVPYDESYFDPVSLEELPHEPFERPTASSSPSVPSRDPLLRRNLPALRALPGRKPG